uniref:Uncharacterized protein n=1 Tax=Setaria viridis TaxID=4556 RepID=A0A4U6VX04_SETVI|nr:hypothetical protein SEVIR_2G229400v2 [Setaria viridis]
MEGGGQDGRLDRGSSAFRAAVAGAEAGRGGGAPEQQWGFGATARRRRLRSNGRWGGGALEQRWVPGRQHGRHGCGDGEEALEQRPAKGRSRWGWKEMWIEMHARQLSFFYRSL